MCESQRSLFATPLCPNTFKNSSRENVTLRRFALAKYLHTYHSQELLSTILRAEELHVLSPSLTNTH
jgi:hypothetical protein